MRLAAYLIIVRSQGMPGQGWSHVAQRVPDSVKEGLDACDEDWMEHR